jgi:agmatine/peptidylarginine deiminase
MSETFSMLPEWVEQEAVMLAWPHHSTDWEPWLTAIQHDYVALASAIAEEVMPLILCQDEQHKHLIEVQLAERCKHPPCIVIAPYNDTWCRDYGPVATAANGNIRLLDFQFNGWGDKYAASLDNNINQQLQPQWQAPVSTINYELEGGSIETDGRGTLLTTTHCLLDSNRNQDFQRADVEHLVLEKLGLQRVLWLSKGALIGDDTDSHIDNLVRFCDAETLAYASCSRVDDPHFIPLQEMAVEVKALRQPNGMPYRLQAIEIPEPQFDEDGKRLPGSYVNFLIVNNSVLVPVFGCPQDAAALNRLQGCFPGKRMVPVPGSNLIKQYGGPHCATMQLPKGTLKTAFAS